jgi:acetyl-CoA carboxylase biotin carboxyl carrier protein
MPFQRLSGDPRRARTTAANMGKHEMEMPSGKSSAGGSPEKKLVRELAELLAETGLSEIEIERNGLRVRVARNLTVSATAIAPSAAPPQPSPAERAAPGREAAGSADVDPAKHPGCVKSPMVGTAYRSPEPSAAPFIEIGARVTQGQTLLIIEAMKTMNHIPAPRSGTVSQIFFDNGQPVEFGEPLVIVD